MNKIEISITILLFAVLLGGVAGKIVGWTSKKFGQRWQALHRNSGLASPSASQLNDCSVSGRSARKIAICLACAIPLMSCELRSTCTPEVAANLLAQIDSLKHELNGPCSLERAQEIAKKIEILAKQAKKCGLK